MPSATQEKNLDAGILSGPVDRDFPDWFRAQQRAATGLAADGVAPGRRARQHHRSPARRRRDGLSQAPARLAALQHRRRVDHRDLRQLVRNEKQVRKDRHVILAQPMEDFDRLLNFDATRDEQKCSV